MRVGHAAQFPGEVRVTRAFNNADTNQNNKPLSRSPSESLDKANNRTETNRFITGITGTIDQPTYQPHHTNELQKSKEAAASMHSLPKHLHSLTPTTLAH